MRNELTKRGFAWIVSAQKYKRLLNDWKYIFIPNSWTFLYDTIKLRLLNTPENCRADFAGFELLLYENPLIQKRKGIFTVPTVYIKLLLWTILDDAMLIKYVVDAIKIIIMNFTGCRIVFNHKRDQTDFFLIIVYWIWHLEMI